LLSSANKNLANDDEGEDQANEKRLIDVARRGRLIASFRFLSSSEIAWHVFVWCACAPNYRRVIQREMRRLFVCYLFDDWCSLQPPLPQFALAPMTANLTASPATP
jgi:hypothetical protein